VFILLQALVNILIFSFSDYSLFLLFIINITGLSLVLPAIYLLKAYLIQRYWIPLTVDLIHNPIEFSVRYILFYLISYVINIYMQLHLPEEFYRFALFCLATPVILLAFQYGWQGALFGTTLNSIALISTAYHFTSLAIIDLLLSIIMQTIMGIFLGLAIQYLRDLNSSLSIELKRNKQLTHQLISTEESIRKDISRDLHDEVGQNITAIRTQALILKRVDSSLAANQAATTIEQLSLNIYDTTKALLNRIRPKILDDLELKQALRQLFLELDLSNDKIQAELYWENKMNIKLPHLLEITLYRICQEGLNNIIKYAGARKIIIDVKITDNIRLLIQDDGRGFDTTQIFNGFGLRGMRERVQILGGEFEIHSSTKGTVILINLPY
ncbi:signal transduction histidine-protein kinase/phosphatase UhpB, partial [Pasteurellaceae bacterium USgator41]